MPDLPSSPRKTVSSVSAAARSQTQKKPGAPKPKGAVRAKSGCYTCRIRRKKCDEQPNADGACQTCVRLRLQCLGFGAKRPEWMRENNSVTELREKIKTFLASQGMIKGHSGSGPRSTEGEPPVLVLVENLHTSPSSPPTPTLSATSSDGHRPPQGPVTSYVRDGSSQHYHPPTLHPEHQHHYTQPPPPPPSQNSWQPNLPELTHQHADHRLPPMNVADPYYHNPNSMLPAPPTSLVPISPSSAWPNGTPSSAFPLSPAYLGHTTVTTAMVPAPTIQSSYGSSYHFNDYSAEDDIDSPPGRLPMELRPNLPMIPSEQTELVYHYIHNVLPIQYLLADSSISDFMIRLLQTSASARDAACMLSALHLSCVRYRSGPQTAVQDIYQRLSNTLFAHGSSAKKQYTEGDAMAGLHVVSTFLFSGGRGAWEIYLDIACQYVRSVLDSTTYYGPEDALKKCSESTRFIIKTTMWFDVLASVTTQTIPRFLADYRQLFGREGAYIEDLAAAPEISMLPVMGCENHIVLAIAEISNLAHWKESQQRRNCLSVPQLVQRGTEIEKKYLLHDSPLASASTLYTAGIDARGHGPIESDIYHRRRLTNDIFRASARVYLHTVLSGDYPSCPEIMQSVTETINCLRQVPPVTDAPNVHRGVVRSVVFGICISGCLTDNIEQRNFLLHMLETQQGESVGNVSEVKALMQEVWKRRKNLYDCPVHWRNVMRESQELLLLV